MIRHVGNLAAHHLASHQAARPVKNVSAETNPFRSVLDSTSEGGADAVSANTTAQAPAAATSTERKGAVVTGAAALNPFTPAPTPAASSGSTQAPAQIQATITKPAATGVALAPPVFEQGPTVTNPDGSASHLNWNEFADGATAEQIAAKLGGTVSTSPVDGFSVQQRGIKVPGSDNLINAGIAAKLFAQYGDKPGSLAWQVINRDLGRDPMST